MFKAFNLVFVEFITEELKGGDALYASTSIILEKMHRWQVSPFYKELKDGRVEYRLPTDSKAGNLKLHGESRL